MKAAFKKFTGNTTFKKKEFLDLALGRNTIRFLHDELPVHLVHYIKSQRLMVKCLGEACPICKKNQILFAEAKSKAGGAKVQTNNIPGYISRTQYAYANVLDRTPVKICPNEECKAEIKAGNVKGTFPVQCPKCGTPIHAVVAQPLNRVKIYNFGTRMNEQYEAIEVMTNDEEGTPLGITNFDINILVTSDNKAPQASNNTDPVKVTDVDMSSDGVICVKPEDLFDLTDAVSTFSPDELDALLRGTPVREVYAARKADAVVEAPAEGAEQVLDDIAGLFNL